MAKVQIKSEKLTPFGEIFMVMEQFDSMLAPVIDLTLGQRCSSVIGYQSTLLISTGELREMDEYDVDFDHQFLESEKYDAKPTYKKFLGYRPGVYVIGDRIVYIENSDGNTNVRFYQADTHKRFFSLLESNSIRVNRFRADCGSCSKEIVSEIEKHCKHFYIRANRCSSLYNDIFALREWKTEEINGILFELNSILVEKWEGKCYRLVIQRQRHTHGELDLWEGKYTYRCILIKRTI